MIDSGVVAIVTLKRRKFAVREVPIPPKLAARLDRCFGLRRLQRGELALARASAKLFLRIKLVQQFGAEAHHLQ